MAPRFGIMSIIRPGSGEPPAVIMARMSPSWSAGNISFGGLPPASKSSNFSLMRCISVLGKREKTRTFSGIGTAHRDKNEGAEVVAQFRPSLFTLIDHASIEQRAGVDLHARSHGGRNRDALDAGALGARGL